MAKSAQGSGSRGTQRIDSIVKRVVYRSRGRLRSMILKIEEDSISPPKGRGLARLKPRLCRPYGALLFPTPTHPSRLASARLPGWANSSPRLRRWIPEVLLEHIARLSLNTWPIEHEHVAH